MSGCGPACKTAHAYTTSDEFPTSEWMEAKLKDLYRTSHGLDAHVQRVEQWLKMNELTSANGGTHTHSNSIASNTPIEDYLSMMCAIFDVADTRHSVLSWGVYDGHAGPYTSHLLQEILPTLITIEYVKLKNAIMAEPGMLPDESSFDDMIKAQFQYIDAFILAHGKSALEFPFPSVSSERIGLIEPSMSGPCALFAIMDTSSSLLRVACVGDSRAVLGRYSHYSGSYSAVPSSTDQTGFNPAEVARIKSEYPRDEKIVDEKTGRIHGIAVSRAFGDARWKWPDELVKAANRSWMHHGRKK